MNKKILFAGAFPFKKHVRVGIHQYARLFAKHGWDVCFLSSQLSPLHLIRKNDRQHAKENIRLWRKGGERNENIFSYSYMTLLPILPFCAPEFVINNTFNMTTPSLSGILSKNDFKDLDIIWLENPHLCRLPSKLKPRLVIYRIADDIKEFGGYSKSIIRAHEEAICKADIVITTARSLYDQYKDMPIKGKVLYLPNGADFDHFENKQTVAPTEYNDIPNPIVLFVGTISWWLDQELVIKCAEKHPNTSFVLVGPTDIDLSKLKRMKNIHILGSMKYDKLPPFLHHADAAFLPFKRSKLVDAISPVKLYEYMAAGLPTVATEWTELLELKTPALIAKSHEEFCEMIPQALSKNDNKKLVSFAKENSWETRFDKIMKEIY